MAMAYLEAACVAYLQRAIGITPARLFPVRDASALGGFAAIEVGRELATLVMLWALGWLLGRRALGKLAWTAVAFGVWDIAYYLWLRVFIDWPHSPGTWDLLFLIPAPWAGPVWAPVAVSVALVGFGLSVAHLEHEGRAAHMTRAELAQLLLGGAIVLWAFLWNAGTVLDGGVPRAFPWLLFVIGLAIGVPASVRAVRRGA